MIAYDGVPETIGDAEIGPSGFIHTDDGTLVAGQPDVAATWYPVNDHPLDKASLHVPHPRPARAWRRSPTASSQGVDNLGPDDLALGGQGADGVVPDDRLDRRVRRQAVQGRRRSSYSTRSIPTSDARRSRAPARQLRDLRHRPAVLQAAAAHDQRARDGGRLSFWVQRDTEPNWDYFFVEAHTAGTDDWTTLRDLNGHNAQDTGAACFGCCS